MICREISKAIYKNCDDPCARNSARALDWIVAVALLVIGALGAAGVLSLSLAAAYGFLGAGAVYTVFMILDTINLRRCVDPEHRSFWRFSP